MKCSVLSATCVDVAGVRPRLAGLSGLAAAVLGVLAVTVASAAEANPAPAARTLVIRERVSASHDKVTLGELVALADALAPQERSLAVLDAPAVGASRRVPLVDLAFALQRFPDLLDANLQGPEAVIIDRAAGAEDSQRVKDKVLAFLRTTSPWSAWKTDALFQAEDERKMRWQAGATELEIRPLEGTAVLGKVPLRLVFADSTGARLMECTVAPVILREARVAVLGVSRERGAVLRADDVQTMPLWLGGDDTRTRYITDVAACVGRELSRSLNAGEILQTHLLLNPQCIKRGDVVWVECRTGGLNVHLAVNAIEGGRLGEDIRVRNPVSGREFQVRTTGERKAALNLTPTL